MSWYTLELKENALFLASSSAVDEQSLLASDKGSVCCTARLSVSCLLTVISSPEALMAFGEIDSAHSAHAGEKLNINTGEVITQT